MKNKCRKIYYLLIPSCSFVPFVVNPAVFSRPMPRFAAGGEPWRMPESAAVVKMEGLQ